MMLAYGKKMTLINTQHHEGRVTPPEWVDERLPWMHIAIGHLKAFLLGTYHGVTGKYLQKYLDEFVYRFNRCFWEPELPLRLLNACMDHTLSGWKLRKVKRHVSERSIGL